MFASLSSSRENGLRGDGGGVVEREGVDLNGVAVAQPKKVLILMSDTGGGHRASAEAIKAAKTLDEMVSSGTLSPELAIQVLVQFDKSMTEALETQVKSKVSVKGACCRSLLQICGLNTRLGPITSCPEATVFW